LPTILNKMKKSFSLIKSILVIGFSQPQSERIVSYVPRNNVALVIPKPAREEISLNKLILNEFKLKREVIPFLDLKKPNAARIPHKRKW
jgi:hypothetical protein